MPPKYPNYNSAYKSKIKLDLEKLKNGQFRHAKVDLTKVNIRTLAKQIGALSEDVKMYMKLLTSKRYHVLNDRTIICLLKGDVDLTGSMHQSAKPITFSDAEIEELIEQETEVDFL